MFRYEIGAHILLQKHDNPSIAPIEGKILAKAPNMVKVEVLSGGWWELGAIRWLSSPEWYSVGRIGKPRIPTK